MENIGAVHELSKISGNLGDRIDDLEKANESVAVSLVMIFVSAQMYAPQLIYAGFSMITRF